MQMTSFLSCTAIRQFVTTGKINRYRISPFRHRNTQMYGQSAPIKAVLDGSVAENQYIEPLMNVLRAMGKFWDHQSSELEDLLNLPKHGRYP